MAKPRTTISAFMTALAASVGCAEPTHELAVARMAEVGQLKIAAGPELFLVFFEYAAIPDGGCFTLSDDFTATVGDAALRIVGRGSTYSYGGQDSCQLPELTLTSVPQIDDAVLVLEDASGKLTCHLGNVLAPRSVSLVPAGAWEFSAGQAVSVRWSPASDLAMYMHLVEVQPVVGTSGAREMLNATRQDDMLSFTLPNAAVPGEYSLNFSSQTHAPAPVADCEIDSRLSFSAYPSQPITIVP